MKGRRFARDIFVVYLIKPVEVEPGILVDDQVPIMTGTRAQVAAALGVAESTVSWYATPTAERRFVAGKGKRIIERISAATLEEHKRQP